MNQELKEIFHRYHKRTNTNKNLNPAAVLIPLFYKEGYIHILFTKRSEQVIHHKGQICFPGGSYQYSDATLLQTALRETEEEIGLIAKDVEVLGELDDSSTITSKYIISPFVALIPYPYTFKPNHNEIKQIFSIPLSELTNEIHLQQSYPDSDTQYPISYFYHYKEHIIWGVTARILNQLIELLKLRSGAPG
jgi:8-oxo-dGTP pyrophosphatase MutT (NUDIX family)